MIEGAGKSEEADEKCVIMFSLHSDSASETEIDLVVHSRKASAMLSNQLPTPKPRKISRQYATQPFEVQSDDADGEKLADKYQMLEELGSK